MTCRNLGRDDADHVVRRVLDLPSLRFPEDVSEPNPFVRYRTLLHAYHVATEGGMTDDEYCRLVRRLDRRVAAIDGHGFRATPFFRSDDLSRRLGFSSLGGVWVKNETGNVSGSHKARHLFGVLVYLDVLELLGVTDPQERPDLALASCGNAALAAAVLAAAAGRRLRVFVPLDADAVVIEHLDDLGAVVTPCARDGTPGDPTVHRLMEALAGGALAFTCQGNLNGLAVEGGETLAWEIASSGVPIERLVVQVGGGALASACSHGFHEAHVLGAVASLPRLDTVQTEGAWPLKRAYDFLVAAGGSHELAYAARHRHEFMWPWEDEPQSVAHGILDDETYDWLAVVEGMLVTDGTPLVVRERVLEEANELARRTTGIPVDPTGSAGLAGLVELCRSGRVDADERVAVLFTGVDRSRSTETKGARDEELHRARHPVAQGLRAG